jgi:replicative DNA helicase
MRMLCSQGNIDAQRFRSGFLSKPEWAQIAKSLGTLTDTRIFLDDSPSINILEMRGKARRLAAEQKRLDLVIVDYLQLMSSHSSRFESRQQEVSQISRELKYLARELNVPVVALSQLSRAPEARADHRPQLADLRESGALEQDADLVAFIYRPEQYKTQEERDALPDDEKNVAQLIIAKQRNGPTGTVDLRFTPSSMRFDTLYRG